MLKLLATLFAIFLKFFRKKDRASEVLSETPVIDEVRREAEAKAEAKYGPRTIPPKR
jgi:hypothetical protein